MGLTPSQLSEFRIARPLGSGSTARVFEAIHLLSGSPVAIKLLEAGAQSSPELKERLTREAYMLAEVSSPHVGRVLGFGYEKDQPFLILERLRGETLDLRLKREGCLPLPHLMPWIEQLLIGVRDCHAAGVIHRDIKPANIFLAWPDNSQIPVIKLIDFGVARIRDLTNGGSSLTSTHHLIGSMGYMAPEQFHDAKGVGPSADLYAVGVVLFRALCGRLPFVDRSLERVVRMKCELEAPRISSMPDAPNSGVLDAFVAHSLSRSPATRFQSADEMLAAWASTCWQLQTSSAQQLFRPRTVAPGAPDAPASEVTKARGERTDVDVDDVAREVEAALVSGTLVEEESRRSLSRPPISAYRDEDEDGPTPLNVRQSLLHQRAMEPEPQTNPDNGHVHELVRRELERRSGKKSAG